MNDKIKKLEELYKTGRIGRYDYQTAIDALYSFGFIPLAEYSTLRNEAIADAMIDLD